MQLDDDLAISTIAMEIQALLGTAQMPVHQLLKMGRGAVIELDSNVDADVKLFVKGRRIAEGELIVNNDRLAVSINRMTL
ncbi:MAG: FliM/FliN family flagellar motor switch protein [Alphaproteobacteria bacterium]